MTTIPDSVYTLPNSSVGGKPHWTILGSELSPYTLKVMACFSYLRIPHRLLYTQGSLLDNVRLQWRKLALTQGWKSLTWPKMSADDEFPLVPYLFGADGENLYDSTAIGHYIDRHSLGHPHRPLVPDDDLKLAFIVNLIDEYADEMGLYMVHHNRWKVAAQDNNAGARLAGELRSLVGPAQPLVDWFFSARQVRRLPYLFSVAPANFRIDGLPDNRQPPSRDGFPPTHALLEDAFLRLLAALEPVFEKRSYLFGDSLTLADASLYGQLAMNLADPAAAAWIAQTAPNTHAWLQRIAGQNFTYPASSPTGADAKPRWFDDLKPLLQEISRVFLPLMAQNAAAVADLRDRNQQVFNEPAFWKNQALYDGELDGHPFRSVAKTFQAKVWHNLQQQWQTLPEEDRKAISAYLPAHALLDSPHKLSGHG